MTLRDDCPITARIVDDLRAVFGADQVAVKYVNENGVVRGAEATGLVEWRLWDVPTKASRAQRWK